MIPPHTKAISKQNTLSSVPQRWKGCFVFVSQNKNSGKSLDKG